MNKVIVSLLAIASLSCALPGCSTDAPQADKTQTVATASQPSQKTCTTDLQTGSLVQKRTVCADANDNGDVQAFHDSLNSRHGGSGGQ